MAHTQPDDNIVIEYDITLSRWSLCDSISVRSYWPFSTGTSTDTFA